MDRKSSCRRRLRSGTGATTDRFLKTVDVVAKIFVLLDAASLRKARLTCHVFRAASIRCLKSLSYSWEVDPPMTQSSLDRGLQVFTSVTCLSLNIILPDMEMLLGATRALPSLRQLALFHDDHGGGADCHCLEKITPSRTAAAGLTSLALCGYIRPNSSFPRQLARALQACLTLVELKLGPWTAMQQDCVQVVHAAICAAPRLRSICLVEDRPDVAVSLSEIVVRHCSLVPGLRKLEGLRLQNLDEPFVVGQQNCRALAQLTCLKATYFLPDVFERDVGPLSNLAGLEELAIAEPYLFPHGMVGILKPMQNLRKLELGQWDADIGYLDRILSGLPALTGLHVGACSGHYRFPRMYRRDGFRSLRSLSICLLGCRSKKILHLLNNVTMLERLVLELNPRRLKEVLRDMPVMPFLNSLDVRSLPHGARRYKRPRASFLARCPSLTHLGLVNVLDVKFWRRDVACLGALTRLTSLKLVEGRPADQAKGPLTCRQLKPLTALVNLEMVVTTQPWDLAQARTLRSALESARWAIGLPRTRFKEWED
eukprot:jgi/Botrbrau1/3130/Bobra.0070s0102.1